MRLKHSLQTFVCVLILFSQACASTDEIAAPLTGQSARSELVAPNLSFADAEYVARGLAMAMNHPANRAILLNAMRDSRWTDHKLDLHSFIATPAGQHILADASAGLGANTAELAAILHRLPAMDLYVPFREHRLTWRGSAGVSVAASFDPDAPTLRSYTPEGRPQELRLADGLPATPLVIMHPAEFRGILYPKGREAPGQTIQAASETGVGTMTTSSCTDEMITCDEDPSSGGSPTDPGVYLDRFYSGRGDGWWGSLEMMFKSRAWEGRADWLGGSYWYFDYSCPKGETKRTYEPQTQYTAQNLLLSPGVTNVDNVSCGYFQSVHGYFVRVWEDDGGLNGEDDDFGIRFFYAGSDPFGAVIGADIPYYSEGGSSGTGQLSAWIQLIYK